MVKLPDDLEIPPINTRDEDKVTQTTNVQSQEKTDEEIIEVIVEASYEGLPEIKEIMIDKVVQDSLLGTPLDVPIRFFLYKETSITESQVQMIPGSNAFRVQHQQLMP